jgi:hypothetical protein
MEISDTTRGFLRGSLERAIDEFMDDPEGAFGPQWKQEDIREYYDLLATVANDLGLSLENIITTNERSDYERERLATMLGWHPRHFIPEE